MDCGVFEGTVFSGLGHGSFYVSIYARNLRRALGYTPYPGTLNLRVGDAAERLAGCIERARGVRIEPPHIPGERLAAVLAFPVEIEGGVRGHIVRPEITVYKGDVVEIVADVYLRDVLKISDGDKVRFRLLDP
ncbi:riboflavin kinase [Aeropyrum pernix]|uniref:Riboflavin kinase n=1 Tax=Aeropyrum pernix TaxID=56636 RepID=A0A401HAL4_AERPX|nr:DUF120 domain-containing protein [Aeropyrum pernix]GBF09447.1 riboflavin kinase [Aeropyrum pernix]